MSRGNGTYLIFDRLYFLMNSDTFRMKDFLRKFECSRATACRDLKYLDLFYDIQFQWDIKTNTYRKVKAE